MDLILLSNIVFIALFFFLKRRKENYTAFYSFSLFWGLLTCGYLFYRYGMREQASTKSELYFYSSLPLFICCMLLLYWQYKRPNGLGINLYLSTLLSAPAKVFLNRIVPAIIFYVVITGLCYLIVYLYESNLPTPIENEPFRYSLMVTHFLWQFLYIIPFTILLWKLEIKKFALTVLVCSILYPFILVLFGILFYG